MRRTLKSSIVASVVAATTACVLSFGGAGAAAADPVTGSGSLLASVSSANGSYVDHIEITDDRHLVIYVFSGSMGKVIPVQVQRPADTSGPRPTLYLLNGAGGGVDNAQWRLKTDALQFLADKPVNVVSPVGGAWSYYMDWDRPDPTLGNNKWVTFLTKELPPIVDAGLGTNGLNAIAGLSSSGTSVLTLAESAPGLYRSAAAYSGCAQIADPVGYQFVKTTVNVWGGGNVDNMFGPEGSPGWFANDPYINAEKLRGIALYISTGNGIPGQYDTLDGPFVSPGVYGVANQIVVGGVIEAATNYCTHNLAGRLGELGIPAHFNFRNVGTHSWGYWQDDLHDSWPVLAGGLGI